MFAAAAPPSAVRLDPKPRRTTTSSPRRPPPPPTSPPRSRSTPTRRPNTIRRPSSRRRRRVGQAGRSDRRLEHGQRSERLRQGRQRRRRTIGENPLARLARSRPRRFLGPRPDDQPGRAGRRQPVLAQGRAARPDAARGLHPPREDHPLRSRADPRAHRPRPRLGGARLLRVLQAAGAVHPGLDLRRGGQADAGLRALLDRARRARLDRHGARRARLRGEVLHRRGQLGPGRQQHAGVLHPGRDEVPRPRPRRQARAALRDAAGRVGARHVLGLRLADARDHPHADVGDVRSRHSPQLPHDAGFRRPHLPVRQRRRASRTSSSSTGTRRPGRIRWCGTKRSRSPAPIPTSTAATSGKRSRRAPIPSGSWACRSSPRSRPRASPSTCSTRPRSCRRSWCRCSRSASSS